MAVPEYPTYSLDVKTACAQALLDQIDENESAGSIKVRDADDVLLATIPLDYPCGTVTAGVLTFAILGHDPAADADGTIAYVEFCAAAGEVHMALPAIQGTEAVRGYAVFPSLTAILGEPVAITSATVG